MIQETLKSETFSYNTQISYILESLSVLFSAVSHLACDASFKIGHLVIVRDWGRHSYELQSPSQNIG